MVFDPALAPHTRAEFLKWYEKSAHPEVRRERPYRSVWITAMMFPSESLNHAALAPPAVTMLF